MMGKQFETFETQILTLKQQNVDKNRLSYFKKS